MQHDALSKEGLQLDRGQWIIKDSVGGQSTEYEHPPFL
jgi:hypothetical protein